MIRLTQDAQTKQFGIETEQGSTPVKCVPLEPPRPIILYRNPTNKGNELERKAAEAARQYVERDHIPSEQIAYTVSPAGIIALDVAKNVRIDVYAVQLYKIIEYTV